MGLNNFTMEKTLYALIFSTFLAGTYCTGNAEQSPNSCLRKNEFVLPDDLVESYILFCQKEDPFEAESTLGYYNNSRCKKDMELFNPTLSKSYSTEELQKWRKQLSDQGNIVIKESVRDGHEPDESFKVVLVHERIHKEFYENLNAKARHKVKVFGHYYLNEESEEEYTGEFAPEAITDDLCISYSEKFPRACRILQRLKREAERGLENCLENSTASNTMGDALN